MVPIHRPTFFVFAIGINVASIIIIKIPISYKYVLLIFIGSIADDVPKMSRMLKILEPTTLPTAISLSPFFAATIEVTSSGSDVPKATIVSPIMASLSPKTRAISLAPSTDKSPPIMIPTNPAIHISILFKIVKCQFL